MKLSALAIVAASISVACAGPVFAQAAPAPVTMQPIANPPEKPVVKAKHHRKAASKPAAKADAPAK